MIGIWAVATYFFAKAGFVCALVITAFRNPSAAPQSLNSLRALLPMLRRLNAGPDASLIIASLLALFGLVVGVCLIARQKWAAGYIVAYHGIALIWFLMASLGLKMIGLGTSSQVLSSPYINYEIASSLLMVAYLLQPRVMRSFGFS